MNDSATISLPEFPTDDMFGFNEAGEPSYQQTKRILETYGFSCDCDHRKRKWGFTFSPDRRLVTFSRGHKPGTNIFSCEYTYKWCMYELWKQLKIHQLCIERDRIANSLAKVSML